MACLVLDTIVVVAAAATHTDVAKCAADGLLVSAFRRFDERCGRFLHPGDGGRAETGATVGLAEFVARQAALALERAERKLRGARYKVPRLVEEEILDRPAFRGELSRLARQAGGSEARATRRAQKLLREIAATHSPLVIDLVAHLIRLLYTQGYGESLQYDRSS